MDLKLSYDLHQEDKVKRKETDETIAKKDKEIADLREEINNWRARFDVLQESVAYIDTLAGMCMCVSAVNSILTEGRVKKDFVS